MIFKIDFEDNVSEYKGKLNDYQLSLLKEFGHCSTPLTNGKYEELLDYDYIGSYYYNKILI